MSQRRLDELEEKLAYMEASNTQLSDEIYRQQQEISALTKAHHQLLERFAELQQVEAESKANPARSIASERPPHY
jgi:uncharacterized coiled-coil protein SlyX